MPIEPWETADSIRRAFHRGCKCAGIRSYNPHSARHFLKLVRDDYCRTPEQRKAWSYNMGHENERITETNYAKMTNQRRDDIFANLPVGNAETEEEKDLLLAYYEHQLTPETPEFERAEQLAEARRSRRKRGSRHS